MKPEARSQKSEASGQRLPALSCLPAFLIGCKPLRLLLFSCLPAFLIGCGTLSAIRNPFVTTTNAVPVVVTVPGATNVFERVVLATTNFAATADGKIVVNIAPAYVTNLVEITAPRSVTNWFTNVVVSVNPDLAAGLETARSLNAAVNPTPAAPFVNLALLGITGALGFFARLKSKQTGEAHGLLRTVIAGVEEAKSPETKAAVEKFSAAIGNAPQLDALVQKLTRRFS